MTAALRPAYDALVARLPTQPHLGVDESPTKQAASKAWLWTFVAKWFTVFGVRPTREATILEEEYNDGEWQDTAVYGVLRREWAARRVS